MKAAVTLEEMDLDFTAAGEGGEVWHDLEGLLEKLNMSSWVEHGDILIFTIQGRLKNDAI